VSISCKWDKRVNAFKAPFGIDQLVHLKREYPTAQVIEGQEYIDFLIKEMLPLIKKEKPLASMRVISPRPFIIALISSNKKFIIAVSTSLYFS
jgi:hypothetical protein